MSASSNLSLATDYDLDCGRSDEWQNPLFNNTFSSSDSVLLDIDWYDPGFDLPKPHNDIQQDFASSFSSSVTQQYDSANQVEKHRNSCESTNHSIPMAPTTEIRSLTQRTTTASNSKIVRLLLQTLKSYPHMMLRDSRLPPFIHPHTTACLTEKDNMEPLDNCISLVQMISSGLRGSRKLFWKNVQVECERSCAECPIMSRWELLAAVQAVLIYILIRLDEGEKDYNNFDGLLLKTVTVIAKQMAQDVSLYQNNTLKERWHNWIFEESARRICVVYQTINMLIYFEPAALCDTPLYLIFAPLPASKALWEASDEYCWEIEMKRQNHMQPTMALAADGKLVELSAKPGHSINAITSAGNLPYMNRTSRCSADWSGWCSGMDEFGGLVMLAAALMA